ncbi:MAG: sugar phosphate isomerase/epimerase [Marinilabiliales bacterium]|nr:sugar phosphate isomerase/epimerase [Marinilabiliales bacterium]
MENSRRKFISRSALTAAGLAGGLSLDGHPATTQEATKHQQGAFPGKEPWTISIFTKCLHWLNYQEMAHFVAKLGFDGLDLTVRPGGHVEPERVTEDLPRAMEAARQAGITIPSIVTTIQDGSDPQTEKILSTAASLGIRHYRMNWLFHNPGLPIEKNLSEMRHRFQKLERLNRKYGLSGEYQNHSGKSANGMYFGGALWDLADAMKHCGSQWLGTQFDINHAQAESEHTWPLGFELLAPTIHSLAIKDFKRKQNGYEGVPLGQGNVDYPTFFALIRQKGIVCPLTMHFEYPLGGAESGNKKVSLSREALATAFKRDLLTLKQLMRQGGLT